jgi:hypothetical protein
MIDRESIPEARLREIVAYATGERGAVLGHWELQQLAYDASNPMSLGLYRIVGDGGRWSLILKAVRSPAGVEVAPGVVLPTWVDELPPTDMGYWRREPFLYRSGILEHLPDSVVAPRCYAVDEVAPKVFWLWLADVADVDGGHWTLPRYVETARHLGQFNGAYLTDHPRPIEPWLQRGWLRSWLQPGGPGAVWPTISSDVWTHPLLATAFPAPIRDRLTRLWDRRESFLAELDTLPHCLCHRDAWPPNLLMRTGSDGTRATVALDWAFAGIGPVGEEIAPLIILSDLPDCDLNQVENAVFAAYIDGLGDSGWRGDPELVRRGYTVTAILRYSFICTMVAVRAALYGRKRDFEASGDEDHGEQTVRQNAHIVHMLLDRADKIN